MGFTRLQSGFETCFGWDPGTQGAGSDTNSKNTSRIQMLLASHFDFYFGFKIVIDWPIAGVMPPPIPPVIGP